MVCSESAAGRGLRVTAASTRSRGWRRVRPSTPWIRRIARTPRAASAASAHCWSAGPTRGTGRRADRQTPAGAWRPRPRPARGAKAPAATRACTATSVSRVEDAHQLRVPLHADFAGRGARAAPDRTRRRPRRGRRCGRCARRRVKNGNAVAASGCSAVLLGLDEWVQTWRRVVPWMRRRAMVRFQWRRYAFCASRLSKRRPFSALSLT